MQSKWRLAVVGIVLDRPRRPDRAFHADDRRHQDPGHPLQGRQGQHDERPALRAAERHRTEARTRHPRRARLHQFARDPGGLCDRVRAARLCRAGARPDRPRLQRSAGFRQWFWRAGRARLSAQPRLRRQGQHRPRGPFDGRLDHPRRRNCHAERLQVDGAGGLVHRAPVRRRRHDHMAAQRRAGVRAV